MINNMMNNMHVVHPTNNSGSTYIDTVVYLDQFGHRYTNMRNIDLRYPN